MTKQEEACLTAALKFATQKHKGQLRRGGEAFITHPVTVCEYVRKQGYGLPYQLAALFHDLLEDTDATEQEILKLSSEEVLTAVKLLTKTKGYQMETYIAGILSNPIALVVKTADRLHNLRSAVCTDEAFKRKYIAETKQWYLDFSPEIETAMKELAATMKSAIN